MQPLSADERTALLRILGASVRESPALQSRQRAALDAYLYVLSQPPLDPQEVLDSARALIRTWAEVKEATQPPLPRKPSERRRRVIAATLLDPPVTESAHTEQMSPMAISDVLDSYGFR
jgi:uncharacterized protein (DUF2236 family)